MRITQILECRFSLFFSVSCFCLSLLFDTPAVPQTPKTPENVELSAEATQLLEAVKVGIQIYKAKLKSGVIDFTLILSGPRRIPTAARRKDTYEEKGRWEITYQFDAEHQFYDVKARYKMELYGPPLSNWKETHHHYLRTGKTVHVWEKIGTEWKEQPTMPSHRLDDLFNPMHWINLYTNFRIFTPITVEKINEKEQTVYALTLCRTDSDNTRTIEMYRDPCKSFLPTRILVYRKEMQSILMTRGLHQERHTEERRSLTRYTYQLEQFEPEIWFPQTTTLEMSETDKNQQPKQPWRKIIMRVNRAIFNTPN